MNSKDFEILTWDSKFFNLKVAKSSSLFIEDELVDFLIELEKMEIDLFYLFTNQSLQNLNYDLYTCQLVDEKITYEKVIEPNSFCLTPNIFSYSSVDTSQELINLAIQSGEYSRFKKDKNISYQKFEELYELWIKKSIIREMAEDVLVYQTKEGVQGLITLVENGNIGLISVNSTIQQQGIGTAMILAAEQHFIKQKIFTLKVITQKSNVKACLFYEKLGYKQKSLEYVYHFWLRKKS